MTEEERLELMRHEMTKQITQDLTASLGPVIEASAAAGVNGSAGTVKRIDRAFRIWNVIGTVVILAIGGIAAFLLKTRDTIKDVENLLTPAEVLEVVETKAPWVADRPHYDRRLGGIEKNQEDLHENMDELKDEVRDVKIEVRVGNDAIIDAIKAGNR